HQFRQLSITRLNHRLIQYRRELDDVCPVPRFKLNIQGVDQGVNRGVHRQRHSLFPSLLSLDRARLTLDNTHENLACFQTRYDLTAWLIAAINEPGWSTTSKPPPER